MRQLIEKVAIRLFVDGAWLHKYWGCHRRPERCFVVKGRQFHLCARCTGLVVGIACSLLLLPIYRWSLPAFCICALALSVDGLTQLVRWRESNNALRFATGLGTGATLFPSVLAVIQELR